MGRRRLRAHAASARDRPWRRALPKTQSDDRASVREHQVQPPDRPLPTPRKIRRTLRMAANHRHPQPPEAPQAPDSPRRGLKGSIRPHGDDDANPPKNNPNAGSAITTRALNPLRNSHLRKAAALGEAESALLECWSSREHRRRAEGLAAGDRAASEKQLTGVLRALGREHQLRSGESYAAELAAAQFPEYVFDSPGAHALPEWAP
jgi:hypothetical protein